MTRNPCSLKTFRASQYYDDGDPFTSKVRICQFDWTRYWDSGWRGLGVTKKASVSLPSSSGFNYLTNKLLLPPCITFSEKSSLFPVLALTVLRQLAQTTVGFAGLFFDNGNSLVHADVLSRPMIFKFSSVVAI